MNKRQNQYIFSFLFIIGLTLVGCEGPTGPQGLQGEKGSRGEDGAANATLFIFDGHSFSSGSATAERDIELDNESELYQNVWLVYLIKSTECEECIFSVLGAYPVPGRGYFVTDIGDAGYGLSKQWIADESIVRFRISLTSGNNQVYDNIHVVRIVPGEVVGKQRGESSLIPAGLDLSDYDEVIEYYGLARQPT